MDVAAINGLRNELRAVSTEYRVVKNTFAKRASAGTDLEKLDEHFAGPTAVLFGFGDPVAPTKVLTRFQKEGEKPKVKAGLLNSQVLSSEEVRALGALPSREVLLGRLLFFLNSAPGRFINVLAGVPRSLVAVLRAKVDKDR